MSEALSEAKAAWRKQMREFLARLTPDVNTVESTCLCDRLRPQMRSAGSILFFAPLAGEPDVWPLLEEALKQGKTVGLPWFDAAAGRYRARKVSRPGEEIVTGQFGVREPGADCAELALGEFHLVLVPGLAFDVAGNRLGRGRGYYDRLLREVRGIKCGICHDRQLVEAIPAEPHDLRVDFILTPDRCVRAKR
jgi:5-formyltetrahydrofolate cyclo-ligase